MKRLRKTAAAYVPVDSSDPFGSDDSVKDKDFVVNVEETSSESQDGSHTDSVVDINKPSTAKPKIKRKKTADEKQHPNTNTIPSKTNKSSSSEKSKKIFRLFSNRRKGRREIWRLSYLQRRWGRSGYTHKNEELKYQRAQISSFKISPPRVGERRVISITLVLQILGEI